MPSLLELPLEIVHMIITIVIMEERIPPLKMPTGRELQSGSFHGIYRGVRMVLKHKDVQPAATSLLMTCKFLNIETKANIKLHFPKGLGLKFDLMVRTGGLDLIDGAHHEFVQTWTRIPAVPLQDQPLCLQVCVRIFDLQKHGPQRRRRDHRLTAMTLLRLLEHFILHGASRSAAARAQHQRAESPAEPSIRFPIASVQTVILPGESSTNIKQSPNIDRIGELSPELEMNYENLFDLFHQEFTEILHCASLTTAQPMDIGLLFARSIGTFSIATRLQNHLIDITRVLWYDADDRIPTHMPDLVIAIRSIAFWRKKFDIFHDRNKFGLPNVAFSQMSWPTTSRLRSLRSIVAKAYDSPRNPSTPRHIVGLLDDTRLLDALVAKELADAQSDMVLGTDTTSLSDKPL